MKSLLIDSEASSLVLSSAIPDLTSDFSDSVERDEFALLFQPILHLASGKIAGVEALVRWDHPGLGRLGAKAVLEAASAAGMAIQLGNHIRAKAMREVMALPAALGDLYLSVNVTAADLGDINFFPNLMSAVLLSDFPTHRLILEITEDRSIADISRAVRVLELLNRVGILVYIDDFGTGFSSLSLIAQLPIFGIKLDHSLTKMMCGNRRERHVVEAVTALAHTLGLSITAEGVEETTDISSTFLLGCNSVQGFGISPPLSSEELPTFVADWTT